MSWNRPARALVVCAAAAMVFGLAGCGKNGQPALSGDPNQISTTTTTAAVTTATTAAATGRSTTSTTATAASATTATTATTAK